MKFGFNLVILLFVGKVFAGCAEPTDWARAFYSANYSFYSAAPDSVLSVTTPEFGALLKKEWAYSQGEVGHLQYNPWLGAQDGDIGKPVHFAIETETSSLAVVSMSYPFVLAPSHPAKPHTAHLILHKAGHACWRLHDFITPLGDSLSYVYSAGQP
ncbi:MAG: hypothetical protein JWM78_3139 [Verrucomicrobiaceae bacterium]|nr:hypothetical protein [Verrucomicrobiaceae bacterium]